MPSQRFRLFLTDFHHADVDSIALTQKTVLNAFILFCLNKYVEVCVCYRNTEHYRLASHFLPDFVLSQMAITTTIARNAANVTIAYIISLSV